MASAPSKKTTETHLRIKYPFVPRRWQAEVVSQFEKYTLLNIHRGGGKTFLTCHRLIQSAFHANPKPGEIHTFLYIAMSLSHAKKTVWNKVFKPWLGSMERAGLVSFNGNDLTINFHDGPNGPVKSQIIMFGVDEPEAIRGQHVHGLVIDEAQGCHNDIFQEIILPTTGQNDAWIMIIGTPNGPNEDYLFYSIWNQKDAELGDAELRFKVITKTVADTGEYPQNWSLIQQVTLPHKLQQEYFCSFDAAVSNRVYFNYQDPIHKVPVLYRDGWTIHVGLDFNVGFMPALLAHKVGDELHIFAEMVLKDTTTQRMADAIKAKYGTKNVFICPDASGASRTTQTDNTNHALLWQAGFTVLSPKKNPLVKHRLQAVNVLLGAKNAEQKPRILIDPSCTHLINTLRFHTYLEGTETPDKRGGLDHCGDALGYLVWQTFPIIDRPKPVRRGFRLAA